MSPPPSLRSPHQKIIRQLLPMLQVLKQMKASDRIILLSHLDDYSKDAIQKTISHVLTSDAVPRRKRKLLIDKLAPYKKRIMYLNSPRASSVGKRKTVVQLGGDPLGYVLNAALPLFVNLFAN